MPEFIIFGKSLTQLTEMNVRKPFFSWLLILLVSFAAPLSASTPKVHTFEVGKGEFLLDGKPFVIKAAEIHYLRIPHEYWEHRIRMCKAMGMNTICAYVFWNIHEQQPGQYDFTGDRDLARFVGLCQKHGLWVILRPGPYSCAEWEMGGLPWWLFRNPDIRLRSQDPAFIGPVMRFQREIERQLRPYKLENGGNIILMQVENEFGSYGVDKPYLAELRDSLRNIGWDKVQMFQCDWSSNFERNALPDMLWTLNFGSTADVLKEFEPLRALRSDSPLMCSEYWSGWFDGWGKRHETRPWEPMVKGIGTMLDNGISFSLYMTHGGTSFGQWAGANNQGFAPDCTSYDYDAPIDEQGAPTEKYYRLRELLQRYSPTRLPAVPKPLPVIGLPEMSFREFAPLMAGENLPEAIASETIQPMEQFGQGYGSILYSTSLPAVGAGTLLRITDMCDYARVYIDGRLIGQLYRGNGYETTLRLPATREGQRLDIFIEAMGRINYSRLIHDRKGITERVELLGQTAGGHQFTYDLRNWQVRLLPVDYGFVRSRQYSEAPSAEKSGYYRTTFRLKKTGDTYLDLSSWGKGLVWVNGHCLGRFWQIGPQQTLFLPGCWLNKGENEIIVMDIVGPEAPVMSGLTRPVIDRLRRELLPQDAVKQPRPQGRRPRPVPAETTGNDAAPGAKK